MKPKSSQLTEMFSDYVKAQKYVDSGWKSIAGNILAFIKDESVTEPGLLTEYVAKTEVSEVVQNAFNNNQVEIPDGSVTVAKLADKSVTAAKLNTGAMSSGELAMFMADGNGGGDWVTVDVLTE